MRCFVGADEGPAPLVLLAAGNDEESIDDGVDGAVVGVDGGDEATAPLFSLAACDKEVAFDDDEVEVGAVGADTAVDGDNVSAPLFSYSAGIEEVAIDAGVKGGVVGADITACA